MHPDDPRADFSLLTRRLAEQASYVPPSLVTVHLTNRCNHQCPWCWFPRNRQEIDPGSCLKTLESLCAAGAEEVMISGGGEPLLYSHFSMVLQFLAQQPQVFRKLYTHGALIQRYFNMLQPAFNYVRISMDAGDAETYARLHGVRATEFNRIFSIARDLMEADVSVGISAVITDNNLSSIPALIDKCAEVGIDYLLLKPVVVGTQRLPLKIDISEFRRPGMEIAVRNGNKPDKTLLLPSPIATLAVTLVPEGWVLPCCHLTSPEWFISAVGDEVDARFVEQHQIVAAKYSLEAHSCRAHDSWQEVSRENSERGFVKSVMQRLRAGQGSNLNDAIGQIARIAIDGRLGLIGITGPSSVGKTTLASTLVERIGQLGHEAALISADDFLCAELRGEHNYRASGLVPLRPEDFDYNNLSSVISRLRRGQGVGLWQYERGVGWKQGKYAPTSADCFVIDGLFLDSIPATGSISFDLVVALEAPWEAIADRRRRRDASVRESAARQFRSAAETEDEIEGTRAAYLAYKRDPRLDVRIYVRLDADFTITEVSMR
jgi:uridine kinase/pyruvate-formate lyase-activating enzyme